jgi:hypothetical protein
MNCDFSANDFSKRILLDDHNQLLTWVFYHGFWDHTRQAVLNFCSAESGRYVLRFSGVFVQDGIGLERKKKVLIKKGGEDSPP